MEGANGGLEIFIRARQIEAGRPDAHVVGEA